MQYAKSLDEFFENSGDWQPSLFLFREMLQSTELTETLKWGIPVYALGKKNVVGMSGFKSYVGLWFYQGALLKDDENKLVNAQEGVTKAMRQWRFTSIEEIEANRESILAYVYEAIENQKQGKEIKPTTKKPLIIPDELQGLLDAEGAVLQAFEGLNLTKKREFAEYISGAKREATKQKRLEKIKPMILSGVGLNDKYR